MGKPIYRNHAWYIAAGWTKEPKERFKAILPHIECSVGLENLSILDVGCATGELLGYLGGQIKGARLVGVDCAEELLSEGGRLLPEADFRCASALSLPRDMDGSFDVVTSIGCMSIFDAGEIETYWNNLLRACRSGGVVIVMAPLNEYGIDVMTQHRKRVAGRVSVWETGWNIFSTQTVEEVLASIGRTAKIYPFRISFNIPPDVDPVKTWTARVNDDEFQLTNGLKLLINHYILVVRG